MEVRNVVSDDENTNSYRTYSRRPRRHTSAYNYYYRDERRRIINALKCEDDFERREIDPDLSEHIILRYQQNGRLEFEDITRLIVSRWRTLSNERRIYYNSLAARDNNRYLAERRIQNNEVDGARIEDDT